MTISVSTGTSRSIVLAAAQLERAAFDLAGDLHFVLVVGERRRRGEHERHRRSEQDRGFQRFAARFGFGLILREMVRAPQSHAQLRVADDLAAVKRKVGNAAVRLACQKDAGGEVRAAVVLEIGDLRQVGESDLLEIIRLPP